MRKVLLIGLTTPYDVRAQKEIKTLMQLGLDIRFAGVKRSFYKEKTECQEIRSYMLNKPIPGGVRAILYLPLITKHFADVIKREKPDVIHCINEEVAFIILSISTILRLNKFIICDIYDHSHLRVKNTLLSMIMKVVSSICHSRCYALIVTDEARKNKFIKKKYFDKTYVVPNYPAFSNIKLTNEVPSGKVKVLCAGALNERRGVFELLKASKLVKNMEIWCAGPISGVDVANNFVYQSNVKYFGLIKHEEVIQLGLQCDAIFAFYKPISVNNIYASPNKLYDALLMGRPIIINAETKISDYVAKHKLGYVCKYDDIDLLGKQLNLMIEKRVYLPSYGRYLRGYGKKYHSWEIAEKSLSEIYKKIETERALR